MGTMLKKMTKMANSLVGYIALLLQLAFLCKGWVGDRSICWYKIVIELNKYRKKIKQHFSLIKKLFRQLVIFFILALTHRYLGSILVVLEEHYM